MSFENFTGTLRPTGPKGAWQIHPPRYDSTAALSAPVIHAISERALRRVLEWTAQYGLLGVLPHRSLLLQSRTYQPTGSDIRASFIRMGGDHKLAAFERPSEAEDSCVLFPKATAPLPVIVPSARVLANFDLDPDSQEHWWSDPTVSPAFWERYCERLAEWFVEAEDLSSIITITSSCGLQDFTQDFMNAPRLNQLLASTGHHLQIRSDGVCRELFYPSLLAAFAAMLAQDMVDHEKRLVTCPVCGALAASSAYRRVYCSRQCAWRARKRRQRSKKL